MQKKSTRSIRLKLIILTYKHLNNLKKIFKFKLTLIQSRKLRSYNLNPVHVPIIVLLNTSQKMSEL